MLGTGREHPDLRIPDDFLEIPDFLLQSDVLVLGLGYVRIEFGVGRHASLAEGTSGGWGNSFSGGFYTIPNLHDVS
jgi:hypothetical protein